MKRLHVSAYDRVEETPRIRFSRSTGHIVVNVMLKKMLKLKPKDTVSFAVDGNEDDQSVKIYIAKDQEHGELRFHKYDQRLSCVNKKFTHKALELASLKKGDESGQMKAASFNVFQEPVKFDGLEFYEIFLKHPIKPKYYEK